VKHTAKIIRKTPAQRVLIAPREGCFLDQTLCKASEVALRVELEKAIRGVQFISHDDMVSQIKKHGLLAIDAYDNQILKALSSETGATTLVTENIRWVGGHYELGNHVYDASSGKSLGQFAAKVTSSISGEDPFVYQDQESGVSLIVPKRKTSGFPVFRYPQCETCPAPVYLSAGAKEVAEQVSLRVTVTEQGAVQEIVVVGSPNKAAMEASISAVSRWHLKPALDAAGKPFAARTYFTLDLAAPDALRH
jgi:hypothetical protein